MNAKEACLCLILVLVSTWTERLKEGSFLVAPTTGTPSFGQEVCPLTVRGQAKSGETAETPQLARLNQEPFAAVLVLPHDTRSRREQALSPRMSGADACYVLMSMQR